VIEDVVIPAILGGRALELDFLVGGPNTAIANAVRGAIVAAPGNELVVADYSNIESRKLAWVCGEQWKLEAYRAIDRGEGVDAYKLLYHRFFGTPLADITDRERQAGKVIDLACGYGGAVGAFVAMAAGYGIDLSTLPALVLEKADREKIAKARTAWKRAFILGEDYELEPSVFQACHVLVQLYREANKSVQTTWWELGDATRDAVESPGKLFNVAKCQVWRSGSWLIIQLPSGRRLLYAEPQVKEAVEVDELTGEEKKRAYVSFMAARGKQWKRQRAWHGLFIENIVQAIANDCLRDAMIAVHEDSLTVPDIANYLHTLPPHERTAISLHVHDELGLDVPKGSYPLERLKRIMTTSSPWAVGAPIAAAGWVGERYRK
jgi:DNA polymerase bacteriophage-type